MKQYFSEAWVEVKSAVKFVSAVVEFVVKFAWAVVKFVWELVKSAPAAVKSAPAVVNDGLALSTADMNRWDGFHSIVSALLLAGALLSLLFHWLGLPAVIAVDLYLLVLLLLAACRCYSLLPDRFTALFIALFTFAALVCAFATVFLENGRFEKRDFYMDSQTKRIAVSSTTLPDAREATSVSLAVITTAAPDYAPTTPEGRSAVAFETVSGLLFLLVAFPILAARLAVFEGPPKVPDLRFRAKLTDGKWQVFQVTNVTTEAVIQEIEVVIKKGKVDSVTKRA